MAAKKSAVEKQSPAPLVNPSDAVPYLPPFAGTGKLPTDQKETQDETK